MLIRSKNALRVCVILSTLFFANCNKKNDVAAVPIASPLETTIKENLKVDAANISFATAGESKVDGFVLLAPTSHGSKQYYIAGKKADAATANAFIALSELSPVTEQSLQEESDDLSLLYKNIKQQVVHIKWDDGQMADFTVNPETFLNLKFPDGYQKLTVQWKDNRSLAITGVKALMETANGLRVNVEKPVIR